MTAARMIFPLALMLLTGAGKPLTIATYAYPDYDRRRALAPLATLIEKKLGRPLEIVILRDPDALRDAAKARQIDIAVTNLASYIGMSALPDIEPVGVLDAPEAVLDGYRGVLLARRDSGIKTLEDLGPRVKNFHYAEVLPGSTSGALVQADALRGIGRTPADFASVLQAGTHNAALDSLIARKTDIVALAEQPWLDRKARRPDLAHSLVALWRSKPLPPGPIVCIQSPTTPCDIIRTALLEAGADSQVAAASLAAAWAETTGATRFIPIKAETYAPYVAAR